MKLIIFLYLRFIFPIRKKKEQINILWKIFAYTNERNIFSDWIFHLGYHDIIWLKALAKSFKDLCFFSFSRDKSELFQSSSLWHPFVTRSHDSAPEKTFCFFGGINCFGKTSQFSMQHLDHNYAYQIFQR